MLTLICGHPRSGKTTYSERFDCTVIHADDCGSSLNVISKVKRINGDIVVDGVYFQPRQRIELLQAYNGEGSRCICIDTPRDAREQRLGHKIKHDYPFLAPTFSEGWDEIIIIRGENVERINRETHH